MAEKIKTGPDAGGVESQTGIERLTLKWQKKVRDSLEVERALYKRRDGTYSPAYFEIERKLVDAAFDEAKKEGEIVKKIAIKLGSLGSSVLGGVGGSLDYVIDKVGAVGNYAYGSAKGVIESHKIKSQILLALSLSVALNAGYDRLTYKDPAQLGEWSSADGAPFDGLSLRDEYKRIKESQDKISVRKLKDVPTTPILDHLDNFDIPTEIMRQIISETLPKNSLLGLNYIAFDEKVREMPKQMGIKGVEAAHYSPENDEIVFTGGCKPCLNSTLCKILIHEIGHKNDWTVNFNLTAKDRVFLMEMVASRLASSNRFNSNYVESIHGQDKKYEAVSKAQEYFAEIYSTYLSDEYVKLPDSDKRLVKWLIKKTDPSFDREKALEKRNSLVNQCEEHVAQKIGATIKSLFL